uniref:ATP-binding cassette domain-containing protein n=1 Tax=Inquilinus sp. TaxID=1932117 RepID=UPI0031D65E74
MSTVVEDRAGPADRRSTIDLPAPGETLLEVEGLRTWFPVGGGLFGRKDQHVRAVEDVSFSLKRGEVVGLVGESGSGKTTAGRSVLRLTEPTAGSVRFAGTDILKLSRAAFQAYRREMQIVFWHVIFKSLLPEALPTLLAGVTLTIVMLIGFSSMAGVIGG